MRADEMIHSLLPTHVLLLLMLMLCGVDLVMAQCQSDRYQYPIYASQRTYEDVIYNQAPSLIGGCLIEQNTLTLDYGLDIYEPVGDTISNRPCLVYAHGGGFLIGDKRIIPVPAFCEAMAKRGFVVVSIDYRKCFNTASPNSAERAVYRAIQDMRAAVRYVMYNAPLLRIDTSLIFAGGNSAGSVMAIHAAYGENDERLQITSTTNAPDLGCPDCTGNIYPGIGKPKAVVNLWGFILDTVWIEPGDQPIISFHGTNDNLVPPGVGVPFNYPVFPQTQGSLIIEPRVNNLGIPNELHVFNGMGHEPWLVDGTLVDTIADKAASFLYRHLIKPELPLISGPQQGCLNDTAVFSITHHSGSTYCWNVPGGQIVSFDDHDATIEVIWNSPGPKSVSVIEFNRNQAASDPAIFNLQVYQNPLATTSGDKEICEGEAVTLQASGGSSYLWTPGVGISDPTVSNPIASPTQTQVYNVEVSNAHCSDYSEVLVTVHSLPPMITLTQVGDSLIAAQGYSYQWYFDSAAVIGANKFFLISSNPGLYYVEITDSNACASTSDTFRIDEPLSTINISMGEYPKIYPNPVKDHVFIELGQFNSFAEIRILEPGGREMITSAIIDQESAFMDVSDLSGGLYLVEVRNSTGVFRKKLIVR